MAGWQAHDESSTDVGWMSNESLTNIGWAEVNRHYWDGGQQRYIIAPSNTTLWRWLVAL